MDGALGSFDFSAADYKHRMAKVHADGWSESTQFEREIRRSAAYVESTGSRPLQNVSKLRDREASPAFIDIDREQVVEQIVSRGDTPEHLAHFFGFSRA